MADDQGISRRHLLVGGAAATLAAAVVDLGGCSRDGDHEGGQRPPRTSSTRPQAQLSGDPFRLGVASGDPLPDRVVLWTRLAPLPLAGGLAGMPDDRIDVAWEVAADERFARIVRHGIATAHPADAHAVHVDPDGLDPATDYHYRFAVGEWTSPVGRTRTAAAPEDGLARLALGVVTCQFFGHGYYAAYRHLQAEDLDLVVHLGDYIYESPDSAVGLGREVAPAAIPVTLDDYRLRYASYRLDPDLQAAHARFPFMAMWDDHEVANNYAGDTLPGGDDPDAVRNRRAAAYRAYWEHLPLRLAPPDGAELTLYRHATFGHLARLYLLDERQYAAEPPCRERSVSDLGNCPARDDDRAYLGDAQDRWLAESLAHGGVTWNLLGNPTVLAGVNMGSSAEPNYFLETWDGYPAARRRLVERLADPAVSNPVVLTGDWHAGMVNEVRLDPGRADSPLVAPELMAPAISSPLYEAPRQQNPQIRHQALAHGYLTVEVMPDQLTASLRVLDDVQDPASAINTDSTWRIAAGDPAVHRVV